MDGSPSEDVPIVIEQEEKSNTRLAEENDDTFVGLSGSKIVFGLAMRHMYTSHTVRWSGSDSGAWPFRNSEFSFTDNKILDQSTSAKNARTRGCLRFSVTSKVDLSDINNYITEENFL